MKILISTTFAESVGPGEFVQFGLGVSGWSQWNHKDKREIDLTRLSNNDIENLKSVIERHSDVRGAKVLLKDLQTYQGLMDGSGVGDVKPRTVIQFGDFLKMLLKDTRQHRIFCKEEAVVGTAMLAYFVERIEYIPRTEERDRRIIPEHVTVTMAWEDVGVFHKKHLYFYAADCCKRTVSQALMTNGGYMIETPELMQTYDEDIALYYDIAPAIGKQFWASGVGMTEAKKWYSQASIRRMVQSGRRSRVVIDMSDEEDESVNRRHDISETPNFWWWAQFSDGDEFEDSKVEKANSMVCPIHPYVMTFDLSRHERMKIHVRNLDEYQYDTEIDEKLILPENLKNLVSLLIESRGGVFEDIVRGKSGGAVVLLAGPPGVGKTLTAEVYAESSGKPLYSIQCSQLGTDPKEIEEVLLKVFRRASRWDAVTLLDEADVYVGERGSNLQQNAIVGVFLRVLEYHESVLFMTTNRADNVDDAIASRCIAKLRYPSPTKNEQVKIWRVLSKGADIEMLDASIKEIVNNNPFLTGRDVKNLLKLASLYAAQDGRCEVRPSDVEFVKQFKPTGVTGGQA